MVGILWRKERRTLQARFKVYPCKGASFWDVDATNSIGKGYNISIR